MPEYLETQACLLSQMFTLKNVSSARGVCPHKAEVLRPAVSPKRGKKSGSPQLVSSVKSKVQGKFQE